MSLVNVVRCQVQMFVTARSFVQRILLCVCVCVSVPSSVIRRYNNPLYLQCVGKRGHNALYTGARG